MPLAPGTVAPEFTLRSKNADGLYDVSLSSHRDKGNVVLLFYPGAFTHVCASELCTVTETLGSFDSAGAVVYGISNDTPYCAEEWAKQLSIGFPLLADFQHEVCRAYDVVWPNFSGLGPGTARAVFVIDKSGVIRYSEQTPTLLDLPDFEALQSALAALG